MLTKLRKLQKKSLPKAIYVTICMFWFAFGMGICWASKTKDLWWSGLLVRLGTMRNVSRLVISCVFFRILQPLLLRNIAGKMRSCLNILPGTSVNFLIRFYFNDFGFFSLIISFFKYLNKNWNFQTPLHQHGYIHLNLQPRQIHRNME